MQAANLPQRALLSLTGEDSISFLQGLISNDASLLQAGQPVYAALLSPQGKFLHDFFLIPLGNAILLDTEAARAQELLKRLTLYKLRANVQIALLGESVGVLAAWGGASQAAGMQQLAEQSALLPDPRLPELGLRLVGDRATLTRHAASQGWQMVDAASYDTMRLQLGVPDGSKDLIVDKTILLEAGFEALHGVSFNKGCYVGQEVTARSKFRGQVKKSLFKVTCPSGHLPEAGTHVVQADKEAGSLRSSQGAHGLAILVHEAVEAGGLQAAGLDITATRPGWWQTASA